jgi:HEPN domain-containing protein
MTENEKIEYWIDISGYDLETAAAMQQTKRLLYVGFMCHQAIEKILKAYYVFIRNETPPYTHNLTVLAEKAGIYDIFSEEQKNFIDFLDPLNIKARYPAHKEQIYKMIDEGKTGEILNTTRELYQWIKMKL